MKKEQFLKDLLERMEDKGIALQNLCFDGDYQISVNELDIELTYSGEQAVIYYYGNSKRVGFIEELAQEVVALLPEEEWEAGQMVRNQFFNTRVLVTAPSDKFNLLNDDTYSLYYKDSYTMPELKEMGWERV